MTFNEFWNGPCRKMQKRLAEKRFAAIPKSEHDKLAVALGNYGDYCRRETWYQPMYASVFLGDRKGWKDWIQPEEPVRRAGVATLFALDIPAEPMSYAQHFCDACQPSHLWACLDSHCPLPKDLICKEALGRIRGR